MNTTDKPLVGILMGSDSDWPAMKPAMEACAEFGIGCALLPFLCRYLQYSHEPARLEVFNLALQGVGFFLISLKRS